MKAVAAGGIEVVVKAIDTHIDNVPICKLGCDTLYIMVKNNGKNNRQKQNKQNENEQLRTK